MSIPIHYAKWIAEFHARPTALLSGNTITGKAETNGYHPKDIIGRAGLHAKDASSAHQLLISKLLEIGFTLMTFDRCEQAYDRRQRLGHDWEDHRLALNLSYEQPIELGYKTAAALQLVTGTESGEDNSEDYLIITEHEIKPLVHDPKLSHWDQPWIDADLKELLFGKSENETATEAADNLEKPLKTYLILDAAARKRVTKVFDIDEIPGMGVEIQCLFKGEAAETYEEVAPYLVDMTLPNGAWDDADLVPEFHKDFFKNHWDKNEGIFVRSRASLDELKQHFRKFTQIQDEAGKWYWFRFWDCSLAPNYFKSIHHLPERVAQWVDNRGEPLVQSFIGEVVHSNCIWTVMPDREKLKGFVSAGTSMLSNVELDGFRLNQVDCYANDLVRYFKEKDPLHTKAIGDEAFRQIIMTGIDKSKKYGLTRKDPVRLYIQLMLGLGASFDKDPLLHWANEVLRSEDNQDGQVGKANRLRGYLLSYLKEVNGQKGEHLKAFSGKMIDRINNLQDDENSQSTFEFLIYSHPQKARYLGSDMLNDLIENTAQLCNKYGLQQGSSLFILSCMRFTYGAGVIDDPQYSWLGNVVKNDPKLGSKDDILKKVVLKFSARVNDFVKEMV